MQTRSRWYGRVPMAARVNARNRSKRRNFRALVPRVRVRPHAAGLRTAVREILRNDWWRPLMSALQSFSNEPELLFIFANASGAPLVQFWKCDICDIRDAKPYAWNSWLAADGLWSCRTAYSHISQTELDNDVCALLRDVLKQRTSRRFLPYARARSNSDGIAVLLYWQTQRSVASAVILEKVPSYHLIKY